MSSANPYTKGATRTGGGVLDIGGRVKHIRRLHRVASWAERRDAWKVGRPLNPPTLVTNETYEEAAAFHKAVEDDLAWGLTHAGFLADQGCG